MKTLVSFAAAAIAMASSMGPAQAVDTAGRLGLGFTSSDAPVGGRYWINETVGLDAGIGLATRNDGEDLTLRLAGGVPFTVINADRSRFNIRPGIMFQSRDVTVGIVEPETETETTVQITAQLEFEVFGTDDFSVRASHGAGVQIFDPAGDGGSSTDFFTSGGNATSVGFFWYLP